MLSHAARVLRAALLPGALASLSLHALSHFSRVRFVLSGRGTDCGRSSRFSVRFPVIIVP